MNYTRFKTPKGDQFVMLEEAEFERLCDKADVFDSQTALAQLRDGLDEAMSSTDMKALLSEPTPIAFWRKKRGLTQKALAERVGISQSYMAALEAGNRRGDPSLFKRLAKALAVRMEDIVAD